MRSQGITGLAMLAVLAALAGCDGLELEPEVIRTGTISHQGREYPTRTRSEEVLSGVLGLDTDEEIVRYVQVQGRWIDCGPTQTDDACARAVARHLRGQQSEHG